MPIPIFPEFAPVSSSQKNEISLELSPLPDGISEFSFAGFFLFREQYQYRVSKLDNGRLVFSGVEPPRPYASIPQDAAGSGNRFFVTPSAVPEEAALTELLRTHDYWKLIPESLFSAERERLEARGIEFREDRDNFDYLYLRGDLAELAGRKYHKKRNLVAQFIKSYAHEKKTLAPELIPEALEVLALWRAEREDDGDYEAAREALEHFEELNLSGMIFYIEGKPAAFCLGEAVGRGRSFAVHFEKGLDKYKGVYQFMNQAFASSLSESFTHINREQDLGDAGLRHAKMSYSPALFVRKYTGCLRVLARAGKGGTLRGAAGETAPGGDGALE